MSFTKHPSWKNNTNYTLKGVNTMKKLVIIVLAIFVAGYVALMVQYF